MEARGRQNSVRRIAAVAVVLLGAAALWWVAPGSGTNAAKSARDAAIAEARDRAAANDPRLAGAFRFEEGGWVYVHLEGDPSALGYQHGYLLAPEIEDAFAAVQADMTHTTKRDWAFFRQAAHEMLWPKLDAEFQQELRGIVEGLRARTNSKMDLDDLVAFNAFEELPGYYVPWYNKQHNFANAPALKSPGNCSAFVATGSWTKDRQIVIAHNNWTSYLDGERWRIIFDIAPKNGFRMLIDGFPGVIASDDDFGINSAGLMVTETTISQFEGWNPNGKAEFVRARKALQYASSIDDYVRIMLEGNNGGYANDWLLGDRKTGEIAQFELGLKAHRVWRTRDGAFSGSNWPRDPQLIKLEAQEYDPKNPETSPNARRARWDELLQANRGKIDVPLAQQMLGDHRDTVLHKDQPGERTLCGHTDASSRGISLWEWGPYFPGGAVQGKAADSAMAAGMKLTARIGHPCGADFSAGPFLAAHPEYAWQAPFLRDMKAGSWTEFRSGERPPP
jgi:hypothetical protein